MEEQLYAIARHVPTNHQRWIKSGKPYEIREFVKGEKTSFEITDEQGDSLFCLAKRCGFLEKRDWTIVKESDLTPEQRRMAGLPTEDATIAELRERIEALEARVPVEEKAEPEWPDGKYYYITDQGHVAVSSWIGSAVDDHRRDFLGIYKTRSEAQHRAREASRHIAKVNASLKP